MGIAAVSPRRFSLPEIFANPSPLNNPQSGRKKVAIIAADSLGWTAPWTDPTWAIWGLNALFRLHAFDPDRWAVDGPDPWRADRWFELHAWSAQSASDVAALRLCPIPVYMFDEDLEAAHLAGVTHAVRYPLDEVLALGYRRYFTSTFAYQVALAILLGYEEIGLYGVELGHGTPRERVVEKAGLEYWLGIAEGRGIRVTLPSQATGLLYHPPLYGRDYDKEVAHTRALMAELKEAMARHGDLGYGD